MVTISHDDRVKYFSKKPSREQLIRVRDLLTRKKIEHDELRSTDKFHMSASDAVDYDVMLLECGKQLDYLGSLYELLLICHVMEPTQFGAWQYQNGINPQRLDEIPIKKMPRADSELNISTRHTEIKAN